jgi:hypothetical protein
MKKGSYVRTAQSLAWMKEPWTCPKCATRFERSGGKGTHLKFCGNGEELFWKKVDKNGPNGCWVWTGATNKQGYGACHLRRYKWSLAHRAAWFYTNGDHTGWDVLHKCNNVKCVNPDHLYLGNDVENSRDRLLAGSYNKKITVEQILRVRELLALGTMKGVEIAREVGVTTHHVSSLKRRRNWNHIH